MWSTYGESYESPKRWIIVLVGIFQCHVYGTITSSNFLVHRLHFTLIHCRVLSFYSLLLIIWIWMRKRSVPWPAKLAFSVHRVLQRSSESLKSYYKTLFSTLATCEILTTYRFSQHLNVPSLRLSFHFSCGSCWSLSDNFKLQRLILRR